MSKLFDPGLHLIDISKAEYKQVVDDFHVVVEGIEGVSGASARSSLGATMGLDKLILHAGSVFPLHTHEGDHLLYVRAGAGVIHIDGVDYQLTEGQTIFIPAVYPHGLRGPASGDPLEVISFSIPHHPIDSSTRMTVVRPETEEGPVSLPDINTLLDQLLEDDELRRQWELNPSEVAKNYALTDAQLVALRDGDVDALLGEGLAERHIQQMRVSW
jgi:mannose-6-phosphate isomerase-like protein (cupin superfamily)